MKCTWRRPAKQLWEPTISSSPVTKPNSQKPANAWRKIKKSCLPFTTSRPNLAAFTDHQPHRIHLCYRPTTNSPNKGLRFTNSDTDNGLQTRSGSSKALASAPGLRTDPKGSHWRTFRRRRGTNPTGRLINHFNKDAPVP